MKATLNKIFSVLLAVCFVLSAIPAPAAAAEIPTSSTTNGYYNGNDWVEGGNGSTTHTIDGTNVTLSKTAAPVEGLDNTFDITLKVQTSTTTTTTTKGGAVVLVIDTSNSMTQSVSGTDRINAAKVAARNFLASYAGTDATANRQLAIVSFNRGATTPLPWVNVAGGADHNNYNDALDAINGLTTSRGTNMEAGLSSALSLLNSISASSESVVLLSDGAPTASSSTDDSWGNEKHCTAAANQASAIKNSGAKLYTVCFGAVRDNAYGFVTVSQFLSGSVASSGCAYDADDASQLNAAFKAISESITSGLDGAGWTATDPMADMITVTGGTGDNFSGVDGTYTWKLTNATTSTSGNVTTYTYAYTYRVTLNVQGENFEEGKFFPTNEPTYLNVDGKQYAFPVPGVKGVLPRTDVTVTKVWDDADNQDNIRPKSVQIQLYANDVAYGAPVTVTGNENTWTYTFDDLKTIENGKEIKYTAKEINLPNGYNATYSENGLTITNTHEIETIDISGTKTWFDADNQDNIRPTEITVILKADSTEVARTTANADCQWSYQFADMPVYQKGEVGKKITYTVEEVAVPNYTTTYDGNNITNTHAPDTIDIEVSKVWDDTQNQDGKRPEKITIKLLADNEETDKTLTLNESNNWHGTFEGLTKNKAGEVGVPVNYTVEEVLPEENVKFYPKAIHEMTETEDGYSITITNVHELETTSVSVTKVWNDANNQDGKRKDATIRLLADKVDTGLTLTLNSNKLTDTFSNLPKYKEGQVGQEIVYTISEDAMEGYNATITGDAATGFTVTNTHTPEKTSVKVTKVWADNENQDAKRPNSVTIVLMADGHDTEHTLELLPTDGWTDSFTGLDKYKDGKEIEYDVREIPVDVEGYSFQSKTGDMENGFVITNGYKAETITIEGTKIWNDKDDQDGKRPDSITVNLKSNGDIIDTEIVTPDANGNWTFKFDDKPKNNKGVAIIYTVEEVLPEDSGYNATYSKDSYDITNTYNPDTINITVEKVWQDNNDQDGIRPDKVTVYLLAGGEKTGEKLILTEENKWRGTFEKLDKNSRGTKIEYSIEEEAVKGYDPSITGDQDKGFTITNTHEPEMIEKIVGKKTWVDGNNQDGKRPESITVKLKANGVEKQTVTVDAKTNWIFTFENLPMYENGEPIIYTVDEAPVEGYIVSINQETYEITNTYSPEEINIKVTKSWVDSNDADKIRPTKVTIYLLANGEKTGDKLVLTAGDKWTGSFNNMPKYEDGKAIKYTIEEKEVKDYKASIKGSAEDGFTVTNSLTTIPKTGDERTPILWISMMALGIIAVFFATRPFFVKKGKYSR